MRHGQNPNPFRAGALERMFGLGERAAGGRHIVNENYILPSRARRRRDGKGAGEIGQTGGAILDRDLGRRVFNFNQQIAGETESRRIHGGESLGNHRRLVEPRQDRA